MEYNNLPNVILIIREKMAGQFVGSNGIHLNVYLPSGVTKIISHELGVIDRHLIIST